ncbi:MAG: hypothetical protein QM813_22860 [Verrucomicrobiota bacterium]
MRNSEDMSPHLLRRTRVVLSLLLLSFFFLPALAEAASKAADEKPAIPSDLFFAPKSIPNEDNAIYLWRRAAKVMVKANDTISDKIAYAWKPESPAANEEDAAAICHWLKQNQEALELMELSLKKPAAKWLATRGVEEQPELFVMNYLVKARNLSADFLATQGKWEEAASLLKGNLRLAQIAIESEAALIHYLVGTASRTLTQRAILRLANRGNIPIATLRQLLEMLPPLNSETNAYANLMRVEFTVYAYPTTDMKWFAQAWAKPEARELVSLTYDEEFQRPFMILTDPGLVALHPKPYDERAGLERASATYRRYRTNVFSHWANRVEADEDAIAKVQTGLLEEIEPLMETLAEDALPLNQKGIAKAKKIYLSLTDPIGRILQCRNNLLSVDDSRVFKNRTEREAVRAIIAAIIFERQKEQLPVSLNDIREEKILTDIPWDFFANAPLKYSKEQRMVWSIGEDAEDDEGDGSPEAPWRDFDAVWKIPNRIK